MAVIGSNGQAMIENDRFWFVLLTFLFCILTFGSWKLALARSWRLPGVWWGDVTGWNCFYNGSLQLLLCNVVAVCGGVVVWPRDNANVVTATYGCKGRGGGQKYKRVATPSKTDHLIVLLLSPCPAVLTPHSSHSCWYKAHGAVSAPSLGPGTSGRPVSVSSARPRPAPPQGRTRPPRLTGRQSALDTLTSGHLTFAGLDLVLGKQEQCCREWRPVLTIATPSDLDTVTKPQPTLPLDEYQFSVLGFWLMTYIILSVKHKIAALDTGY